MSTDDLWSLGCVLLGIGLGSYVGYRLSLGRAARTPRNGGMGAGPLARAALPALGSFLGVAVAEDVAILLRGHTKPGFALVKYLFAAATWITQAALLRRAARDASGQPVNGR